MRLAFVARTFKTYLGKGGGVKGGEGDKILRFFWGTSRHLWMALIALSKNVKEFSSFLFYGTAIF